MTFPDIKWRSALLPACVALVAIAGLAWSDPVRIPAQQRYLNERNLRLLRTFGAQIKSKVDNFDLSLDHALDTVGDVTPDEFKDYVKLWAPELEIRQFSRGKVSEDKPTKLEHDLFQHASDPPRITIQRDEGTNFLYIGYKRDTTKVVAKADLGQVIGPFISSMSEFDAVLLTDRLGRVIAQKSSAGIEVAHVDRLKPATPAPAQSKDNPTEPATLFESLRVSSNVEDVILGDVPYKFYIQPIQLSLASFGSSTVPAEQKKQRTLVTSPKSGRSVDWCAPTISGRATRCRYTSVLLFVAALVAVCLMIPQLKPHLMNPRERLREHRWSMDRGQHVPHGGADYVRHVGRLSPRFDIAPDGRPTERNGLAIHGQLQ